MLAEMVRYLDKRKRKSLVAIWLCTLHAHITTQQATSPAVLVCTYHHPNARVARFMRLIRYVV